MTRPIEFAQISATRDPNGVPFLYLLDEHGELWEYYRGEYTKCALATYKNNPPQ